MNDFCAKKYLEHLLFLMAFTLSFSAQATQYAGCIAYLLSARQNHLASGLSAPQTKQALSELRRFRFKHLNGYRQFPSADSASATEAAAPSDLQKVTSRVTDVVDPSSVEDGPDAATPNETRTYGTVLEGYDKIRKEFEFREKLVRDADHNAFHYFLWARTIFDASSSGALLYGATAIVASQDAVGLTLLTAIGVALRWLPEETIRFIRFWDSAPGEFNTSKQSISKVRDGHWSYRSFNFPVPLDLVNRVWETNEIFQGDLAQFSEAFIYPRHTRKLTGDTLMLANIVQSSRINPRKLGWIQVDELITFNPDSKQEELVTVVRVTKQLPEYPVRLQAPLVTNEKMATEALGTIP